MTKQEKADCRKIAEHYGWKVEKDKLIEEMEELKEAVEEVDKYKQSIGVRQEVLIAEGVRFFLSHMAEEIADVEICLQHIKCFGGERLMQDKVKEYRKAKIARQLQRMEAGE